MPNKNFDLTTTTLKVSSHVRWDFSLEQGSIIESLRSKSLRKFLRTVDTALTENGISWEYKQVSSEEFGNWLEYYEQKMSEKDYDILASMEWFNQKPTEGKTVEGLFFYQQGQLVGSGIVARTGLEKASLAFRVSEKITISNIDNGNLGSVIDYFFIKKMQELGVKIISGGHSYNAFGSKTTIGYLEYKTKFYSPSIDVPDFVSSVPLSAEGDVLFYAYLDDQLKLIYVKPQGLERPHFNSNMFVTKDIELQVLEY